MAQTGVNHNAVCTCLASDDLTKILFPPHHHHLTSTNMYTASQYLTQMSQIPKSEPTAKSPSLYPEWLKGLIQRRQINAAGQESAIITLASRSLGAIPITSSNVVLQSRAENMSRGHLVPAPGTEFAIDSSKTLGSRARDYTNIVGTTLAPFVGAIPVVGAPLKDVIGGLLGILTIVDVSAKCRRWHPTHECTQKISQNEQAIKTLTSRLCWLLNEIGTFPEASTSRSLQLQQNMILYSIYTFITDTSLMQYLGS